jgi:hypothetical protein
MANFRILFLIIQFSLMFSRFIYGENIYEERVYHSPYLTQSEKELLLPFLIDETDSASEILDAIFQRTNPMKDKKAFESAGFITIQNNGRSLVGFHPTLPEYIIKGKRNKVMKNHQTLFNRLINRAAIQWWIDAYNPQYIVIPNKVAYPLPSYPNMPMKEVQMTHGFIVIADTIDIKSNEETIKLFKNPDSWCEEMIIELYAFSRDINYPDAAFRNIRFTQDMRIAIIDFDSVPSDENALEAFFLEHLPSKWKAFWRALKANDGS